MELCFVLRVDIKESILLLFGMHGQKVGTQSLSPGNSDGICNTNHSISYCVRPNGPRRTMTAEAVGQTLMPARRQINEHICTHTRTGALVAYSQTCSTSSPFVFDYSGEFGLRRESPDMEKVNIYKAVFCSLHSNFLLSRF